MAAGRNSRRRKTWWSVAAAAVERGSNFATAARRAGVKVQTLYNERLTEPDFRHLLDEARWRYHRKQVDDIERINSRQLAAIRRDLRAIEELDPALRTLARGRTLGTLNRSILTHHVREAEKFEGRGELAKSDVTLRTAALSNAELTALDDELQAELAADEVDAGELDDDEDDEFADPDDLDAPLAQGHGSPA